MPLFPGYVFGRFDPAARLPVLTIPGVLHIVGMGKTPVPVPDIELAAIEAAIRSCVPIGPWPCLSAGQRVLVERGPLRGQQGILIETRKDFRLVISVSLLHRAVAIVIDRAWVRPIAPAEGMLAPPPPLLERTGGAAV